MTPTENWPKTFLLQIHEAAVKHGFVWIEPITEADADSLRSRLYRVRRRGDKSMAAFISPEYHLVMIGQWESLVNHHTDPPLGRMPAIYNKRPDGLALPNIIPADPSEVETYTPQLAAPPITPDIELPSADKLTIDPADIGGFVESLRRSAKERGA